MFSLSWLSQVGNYDLDIHSKFEVSKFNNCHVFFGKNRCLGTSYFQDFNYNLNGEESIILRNLGNYNYIIAVNDYNTYKNNTNYFSDSNAIVNVYNKDYKEPYFTLNIPNNYVEDILGNRNNKYKWWLLFCIDGRVGMKSMKTINKLMEYEPKYSDCN